MTARITQMILRLPTRWREQHTLGIFFLIILVYLITQLLVNQLGNYKKLECRDKNAPESKLKKIPTQEHASHFIVH